MGLQEGRSEKLPEEKERLDDIQIGGRLRYFYNEWENITKDKFVLKIIREGCKLNLFSKPVQLSKPKQLFFNQEESKALKDMIIKLEKEKVIEKCKVNKGEFINNVFLVQKNTDSNIKKYRCILNMKQLNKEHVELIHFKMDTLQTCLNLMQPMCFMASIDISNAYHHIPIHPDHSKLLKFEIGSSTVRYLTIPQGYRDSPRIFTKCLKPVLKHLREKGLISSIYIDDLYIQGKDLEECRENVEYTKLLLEKLGFLISEKSIFTPTQSLKHLGFILNSCKMEVSLSDKKREKIVELCKQMLQKKSITIREAAKLIGTLVAVFPAVEYGPLYYREMEKTKIIALKQFHSYEAKIKFNEKCILEIQWWLKEGLKSKKPISHGNPTKVITTDSSKTGWGAFMDEDSTQGLWTEEEQKLHINVLELKAVLLGIQSLCKRCSNEHLQVQMDNTTGITYINNMGGTKSALCNSITKEIILWCKERDIWVTACFIAGKDNVKADALSREFNLNLEWSLNDDIFDYLCTVYGQPDIDLFASRLNKKLSRYYSLFPDPYAIGINAFAHKWDEFLYIYSPFNLINRILRKIKEDQTPKVLIIVPKWTVSPWYPVLMKMCMEKPIELNHRKLLYQTSNREMTHPLFPKMKLIACILSGRNI